MKRLIKKVNLEAVNDLRTAMYKAGCDVDLFDNLNVERLDRMISLARQHHRIAELACNGDLTPGQTKSQETIERTLTAYAMVFNMRAEFGGDPRGFTVKLHAPKGDMYNTWGGAESGYGI